MKFMDVLSYVIYWIFQSRTSRRNIVRRLDDYATYVERERRHHG